LQFSDSPNTTMQNDIPGLAVGAMDFGGGGNDDFTLSGNALALGNLSVESSALHSRTITIRCGLIVSAGLGPQSWSVLTKSPRPNVLRWKGNWT